MKVIFLDRDGVINKYPGDKQYVTSLAGFRFLPQAKKAIALLHQHKFKLFVISNQAGVGKKIFSKSTLDMITRNMLAKIRASGGNINGVYYCIHRPEKKCSCRKPEAGLLLKVRDRHRIDLAGSFFIGDTIRDVDTAKAAKIGSILVLSGKEKLSNRKNWETRPDFIFKNLYAAAQFILKYKPNK